MKDQTGSVTGSTAVSGCMVHWGVQGESSLHRAGWPHKQAGVNLLDKLQNYKVWVYVDFPCEMCQNAPNFIETNIFYILILIP